RVSAVISTLLILAYLTWRAGFTLVLWNLPSAILSIAFLFAEIVGALQQSIHFMLAMRPPARHPVKPLSGVPSVAVLVPTYNEPIAVLERTLVGCARLNYPAHTVYLLDDGHRAWAETLASQVGGQRIAPGPTTRTRKRGISTPSCRR
ncbi:Cellulose synthase (UDP-forming), partial [mine drainage metagenome]